MSFWGILVKRDSLVTVSFGDAPQTRLEVTQATLEDGNIGPVYYKSSSTKLYCKVADNEAIPVCSLIREKSETCSLNLKFSGPKDIAFSVCGPYDIAISGFSIGGDPPTHAVISSMAVADDDQNNDHVYHEVDVPVPERSYTSTIKRISKRRRPAQRTVRVGETNENVILEDNFAGEAQVYDAEEEALPSDNVLLFPKALFRDP